MMSAREASIRRMVQIHKMIRTYVERYGVSPTYREIARACGLASHSTVGYWLDRLEAEGLITRMPGMARSISVKVVKE